MAQSKSHPRKTRSVAPRTAHAASTTQPLAAPDQAESAELKYSAKDLDRRVKLGEELLSAYQKPVQTAEYVDFRVSGPGRQLDIKFPSGLGPKPDADQKAGNADAPLPRADVVVLTYTSDESKALADVFTPGRFAPDWHHYAHGYKALLPKIRHGAPCIKAGRLGSYYTTHVGKKKVLVFKSELHMHQDVTTVGGKPTIPIATLFSQIIEEAKPSYFFPIGTAGGVYPKQALGTVAASRAARFSCKKEFEEAYDGQGFKSDWTLPTKLHGAALKLMKPFLENLAVPSTQNFKGCACHGAPPGTKNATILYDGHDGIPAFHPILTTDYFEFGTDTNHLEREGMAVEMDDAVLGMVCSKLAKPPLWASIRNYSDPTINGEMDMRAQEGCASRIYLKYGYWTSVMGAIATWSVVAGL